jgi:hypothetical protein
MIIYLTQVQPFELKHVNMLEIFNEICILIVSFHLFLFTNFVDNAKTQSNIGWSLILFTVANIVVNMAIIIINGWKAAL